MQNTINSVIHWNHVSILPVYVISASWYDWRMHSSITSLWFISIFTDGYFICNCPPSLVWIAMWVLHVCFASHQTRCGQYWIQSAIAWTSLPSLFPAGVWIKSASLITDWYCRSAWWPGTKWHWWISLGKGHGRLIKFYGSNLFLFSCMDRSSYDIHCHFLWISNVLCVCLGNSWSMPLSCREVLDCFIVFMIFRQYFIT